MKNEKTKKLPQGITLRSDGRYMGRFEYRGQKFTLYNKNLKTLQKEMAAKRYEAEHGLLAPKQNLTVDSWFSIWLDEYKKRRVKQGTYTLYVNEYRLHIQKPLGKMKLQNVRPEHIQKLLNQMADNYSTKTIHLVKVILGGMFKQAVRNGIITKNPTEYISLPSRNEAPHFRVMTVEEQRLFLQYAADSFYYPVYEVALGTGMRNGELRALQWNDIDFTNKIIHVRATLKYVPKAKDKYYFDTPKTTSSKRDIPMLDNVYHVLKRHHIDQQEYKLQLGEHWHPQKGFENLVFTGVFGRCMTDVTLHQDILKIEERIREDGITFEHITPHTLRHTFATRGLEAGIPPKVMQDLLGHKSLAMTMGIYSHVLPDMKAKEIQKIAGLFD